MCFVICIKRSIVDFAGRAVAYTYIYTEEVAIARVAAHVCVHVYVHIYCIYAIRVSDDEKSLSHMDLTLH